MLIDFIGMLNVADKLDTSLVQEIGQTVVEEYGIDKASRADWEKQMEQAEKFVRLMMERKTFPWDGASNVVYPLLAQSCLQFNSRSLPLMVKGQRAVKGRVNGPDPQGIKAQLSSLIGEHMTWQLLEEMDDWLGEKDAMLLALPVYGCAFQKVYRDIPGQKNVSEYYSPMDIVIYYKARNLKSAKRITHVFELSKREIVERQRAGLYRDVDLGHGDTKAKSGDLREKEGTYVILEQHRWLDLDEDGLVEPYVVTVHEETQQVLRIRPRYDENGIIMTADGKKIAKIEPIQYFVRYIFMPAYDRNIYGYGFGQLLLHPNQTLNSLINQLVDAGTLNNTVNGIATPGIGPPSGILKFAPGEMKISQENFDDITKKIYMFPSKEPSNALFQVLGLLLEAGERLGNSVDVLTGEHSTANQPASTTLALIEQGLKFYKAASSRLFKGLREELMLLFKLNAKYMEQTEDQFFRLFDADPRQIAGAAYSVENIDVTPVGAAEEVTIVEKLIKAEQGLAQAQQMGLPWQYMHQHYLRYYEALGMEDIESILPPQDWQPPGDPKAEIAMAELELKKMEQQTKDAEFGMKLQKLPLELLKLKLELVQMGEDMKNKKLKAEVDAAVRMTDSETKRVKVKQEDAKPQNPDRGKEQ
jgi:chaperonin GroES